MHRKRMISKLFSPFAPRKTEFLFKECILFLNQHQAFIRRGFAASLIAFVLLFCLALRRYSVQEAELDRVVDVSHLPPAVFPAHPIDKSDQPKDIKDPWYCDVKCPVGTPCEYKDEVDLRIIVITFNRWQSLEKCLASILDLDTLGDLVAVELWVDRAKDGTVDSDVMETGRIFAQKWNQSVKNGRACIHTQTSNAYISGQWIDTWRPQVGTKELALILEDDISVSRHAYRYLKSVHGHFGDHDNIAGYTLQMEETSFFAPDTNGGFRPMYDSMQADPSQTVFLYPVIGTWGFSPHPKSWRQFQDWYHTVRPQKTIATDHIQPLVPGIIPTDWYLNFLKDGSQEAMWEMWHIKYTHDQKLFTVYSNMKQHSPTKENVYLSTNRKEKGLHFDGGSQVDNSAYLLQDWDDAYVAFPPDMQLVKFNYDGTTCDVQLQCCFTTLCESVIRRFIRRHSIWQMLKHTLFFQ